MSRLLVSKYQAEIEKIIEYGGSKNEASIRRAFENLLNEYCKSKNYVLVAELEYTTKSGKTVKPDGTVKDAIRMAIGYWESKDQYDDLDEEIRKKFDKGYPNDNILFEDSQTAVLYQNGDEVLRVSMQDESALDRLLTQFINYERPEVRDFRAAIAKFKEDIPDILEALRNTIQAQEESNAAFRQKRDQFWEICRESINPEITAFDIQEMLIQHILTEDIFLNIFGESQFHQENNIASELQAVVKTFFKGNIKRDTVDRTKHFYAVIQRTAASIANHHEKQKFLKVIYENFYKAYNPKAADRLGIVYTPNEIVRFMIESADYLVHKHFNKLLADPGVEILDPATGTGTFITELIEYLPKNKLEYKYKNEIHCNEVAILPYYVANLNIELTYKQKMSKYEEFQNICFVDTLDHTVLQEKQGNLLSISVENTERIKRQNDKTISVIVGNPPYNAKQENYSQNNANRYYEAIDRRIKDTYIKHGSAQNQIVVYDMYTRFLRWASERLGRNGVIAFVSNNSFIDSRAYDGFRKVVSREFNELYIIDVKGNARTSGERRRQEGGNIFSDEIRVGIAVYFLIRNETLNGFKIYYNSIHDYAKAEEKKQYFIDNKLHSLDFHHVLPDENGNWLNPSANDFNILIPLADKSVKKGKSKEAIFEIFSSGIKSQRDEWVYDFSTKSLEDKMQYFVQIYQDKCSLGKSELLDIKWDRELNKYLKRGVVKNFEGKSIQDGVFRPFVKMNLYFDKHFIGMPYLWHLFYKPNIKENFYLCLPGIGSSKPFQCLVTNLITCLDSLEKTQCLPLYRYEKDGRKVENITGWGLKQFRDRYNNPLIQPEDIFHYVYAVLHHPAYRTKYELNLKREFPRIPFYPNFQQWADWGQQLMHLHINFETVDPYPLERVGQGIIDAAHVAMQTSLLGDEPNNGHSSGRKTTPKCKLKADKINGIIELDTVTSLKDIPAIAWDYKLGNRSALEWILDQYKEKKPKDPTIAKLFNTYRFADYKEQVIDLLQRVCTVSVETMHIIQQMPDTVEHQG